MLFTGPPLAAEDLYSELVDTVRSYKHKQTGPMGVETGEDTTAKRYRGCLAGNVVASVEVAGAMSAEEGFRSRRQAVSMPFREICLSELLSGAEALDE